MKFTDLSVTASRQFSKLSEVKFGKRSVSKNINSSDRPYVTLAQDMCTDLRFGNLYKSADIVLLPFCMRGRCVKINSSNSGVMTSFDLRRNTGTRVNSHQCLQTAFACCKSPNVMKSLKNE
ncbi:hypothetical protein GQX74_000098 [Glossina fuscipes]|nr:hypothetical protein GQX74_000098 [Glossina fuscipes]